MAIQNLACASELASALSNRGLSHLFLKGPLLSLRLYGEIGVRSVGDVDLLVRPEDAAGAESALREIGFVAGQDGVLNRRLRRAFTHHLALTRERQAVELHWTPAREAGIRLDLPELWNRAQRLEWRGERLPAPDLESALLIQVVGLVKDLELGQFRLRSALDVLRLLERLEQPQESDVDLASPEDCLDRYASQGLARLAPIVFELVLDLFESAGRFPALREALSRRSHPARRRESPMSGLKVFDCRPPAWRNKRRLFRDHSGGSVPTWLWWFASLPWRLRSHGS